MIFLPKNDLKMTHFAFHREPFSRKTSKTEKWVWTAQACTDCRLAPHAERSMRPKRGILGAYPRGILGAYLLPKVKPKLPKEDRGGGRQVTHFMPADK